jgi:hypothetical protein
MCKILGGKNGGVERAELALDLTVAQVSLDGQNGSAAKRGAPGAAGSIGQPEERMMALCLVMQFAGVDTSKYEAVMEELGLRSANPNWPKGILSHVAGRIAEGMCVVDVWESQQDFDAFMQSRLKPAFDAVSGMPQPRVISFQVHNSYSARGL